MSKATIQIDLSYAQLCVFVSSLSEPFNDWSDPSFSQGFSWRPDSVSFRAVAENGKHDINVFIDEPVPPLGERCVRAFQVPFETADEYIDISSISDGVNLEIRPGQYSLQVEFMEIADENRPEINVRLNLGDVGWSVLKGDETIAADERVDFMAKPAN